MSQEKARAALAHVLPYERETWVLMGMAVKAEFGEDGFDMWNEWSQGADSYREQSARSVWRSISAAGKIGIGTLFHEAAANGWRNSGEPRAPMTAQQVEQQKRDREARNAAARAEEERKQRGYKAAAIEAQQIIEQCIPGAHYYLKSKGLPLAEGLVRDGVLYVPMRNVETGALQGLQSIAWIPAERRYEKKMLFGMRAKGSVLCLGNKRAKETFLCEGYATGLSIEMALRRLRLDASVTVCFSDGNLAHVATLIRGRAFVFADNDFSLAGQRAAQKTGLPYIISDIVGEDANDLHQRAGLMALCQKIIALRSGRT